MSIVTITTMGEKRLVRGPYTPGFPNRARALGGKWDAKTWTFDVRDEERVRALCRSEYGTDGRPDAEIDKLTVRVVISQTVRERHRGIFYGGRQVASAYGRDSGARLGDGVVFLQGKPTSGGSVKNWRTVIYAGSIFEIRDIPASMVERLASELGKGVGTFEVVEYGRAAARAATIAERDKLLAYLAEIDARLALTYIPAGAVETTTTSVEAAAHASGGER